MRFSACLLTKNEEKNIGKCLSNLIHYADEIVIIDGYSEDRTTDIAKSFEEKVRVRVYQKEFSGSFAVERNYSIAKARNTWVLVLDADEIPSKNVLETIKALPDNGSVDAYSFLREDITPTGETVQDFGYPCIAVKLAKKDRLRYYGALHERAIVFGKTMFLPGTILHYRDHDLYYNLEKEERFHRITDKHLTGIHLSKTFLLKRGLSTITHYFLATVKMGYGAKSIVYTTRFALSGIKKYRKNRLW